MKLVDNIIKMRYTIVSCLILFITVSCSVDDKSVPADENTTVVSLSVKSLSNSINEDHEYWEDRVDELRMIVFNTSDGQVAINQKLYFPQGFTNRSKGVAIKHGNYNFYFIANESVYTGDFLTVLDAIKNESEFKTDTRFRLLAYNPAFIPDGTTKTGRFLMSAVYNNINVSGGGTEENPDPLILPTDKVELIRSLAKVEVVFRKKVSGGSVPANSITSVQLSSVASDLSVPPADNYYAGQVTSSGYADISGLDFARDSIGSTVFYIPELLVQDGGSAFTELNVNGKSYPIESDGSKIGLALQRRNISSLSDNSVIRNYHYIINAYIDSQGGIQIKVYIKPWNKDEYQYVFQGDKTIVVPPVIPTDSSVIIIPVLCEGESKIEILSTEEYLPKGLQGAYGDVVNYWDPVVQGPSITKGQPPYYCEKKYGKGWRLINSCELMSFLELFDQSYRIWQSNTWQGVNSGLPFYPLAFRQQAQDLLQNLTGVDLSNIHLSDSQKDNLGDAKLGVIDSYFTPGDVMPRVMDYPNGWPYPSPPETGANERWYPNETVIQVKAYWYPGYLDLSIPGNKEKELYSEFRRYDYSSTVSRCVRTVE